MPHALSFPLSFFSAFRNPNSAFHLPPSAFRLPTSKFPPSFISTFSPSHLPTFSPSFFSHFRIPNSAFHLPPSACLPRHSPALSDDDGSDFKTLPPGYENLKLLTDFNKKYTKSFLKPQNSLKYQSEVLIAKVINAFHFYSQRNKAIK
jgi:hypothetical protein